jgi:hypothetical protein
VIKTDQGPLSILMSHSTPPVFDGPEDANGLRNKNEAQFWVDYLRDKQGKFVMALGLNADPLDGDGANETIHSLLTHKALRDEKPTSIGASQANPNSTHKNPDNQDTADWREPSPGNLRVDYVLPSADLQIHESGVFWPAAGTSGAEWVEQAQSLGTRHKLVWIDVSLPE